MRHSEHPPPTPQQHPPPPALHPPPAQHPPPPAQHPPAHHPPPQHPPPAQLDDSEHVGFVTQLKWKNIVYLSLLHTVPIVGLVYNVLAGRYPYFATVLFTYAMVIAAGFGVTGGAHRYWSHRSYKAKAPLRWILLICFSAAGQNTIYEWVRDHRVHHKRSESPADPHDARRGFWFAHVGWLLMRKHPAVLREGRLIDMTDLARDPLVRLHTEYFGTFKLLFCFVLPSLAPLLWGEAWQLAVLTQLLRHVYTLHCTWAVNSLAHLWGDKPYDPNIMPVENWFVSLVALGEGWHNYHHTFPWDYKAAELPYLLNFTTVLLDGFAALGWAHGLKRASPHLVRDVATNRNKHYDR